MKGHPYKNIQTYYNIAFQILITDYPDVIFWLYQNIFFLDLQFLINLLLDYHKIFYKIHTKNHFSFFELKLHYLNLLLFLEGFEYDLNNNLNLLFLKFLLSSWNHQLAFSLSCFSYFFKYSSTILFNIPKNLSTPNFTPLPILLEML